MRTWQYALVGAAIAPWALSLAALAWLLILEHRRQRRYRAEQKVELEGLVDDAIERILTEANDV